MASTKWEYAIFPWERMGVMCRRHPLSQWQTLIGWGSTAVPFSDWLLLCLFLGYQLIVWPLSKYNKVIIHFTVVNQSESGTGLDQSDQSVTVTAVTSLQAHTTSHTLKNPHGPSLVYNPSTGGTLDALLSAWHAVHHPLSKMYVPNMLNF